MAIPPSRTSVATSLSSLDGRIKRALDRVRARCDVEARRAVDPVGVVRRYRDESDREIVALVAALLAFGNVTTIRAKLDLALARLGPHPARAADDEARVQAALAGWKHRVFRGDELARLLVGARHVQRASGSLGARFELELARTGSLRDALAAWCDALRDAGGLGKTHLLPDPRGPSACKRLFLYLRWMVRPDDGTDLGLWNVDPALLVCPVDTHIHKLARNIGFTRTRQLSWKAADEITRRLRRFDPEDPVKYDFALCHMGMLQGCPSRRDELRCRGCGVKPVCRHWQGSRTL